MVSRHDGRRRVVASANSAARALGLIPGTALSRALMMVPGLTVHPSDPDADRGMLDRLAEWCLRYAPLCAVDAPDGLWIDITGCAHLHDPAPASAEPCAGEMLLLEDLVTRLSGAGFAARAAVAGTAGAAHALARHGPCTIAMVPPDRTREALLPLPVVALRLQPDTVAALGRLGLVRVGQLAAMARGPLARRFGAQTLHRLDQAMGQAAEPIVPLVPVQAITHRLAFEDPLLTAEALAVAIVRLSARVCQSLNRNGLGARRLDLVFERVSGAAQMVRVGTAQASRDPAHLAQLLVEHLDKVDPGLGVEIMCLVVSLSEPMWPTQLATDGVTQNNLAVLVDRLENRLGPGRVYRAAPIESDVPERSVRRVPALSPSRGRTWPCLARPVRLLDPPQPIETLSMLPDQPPVAFIWRRVRHRVRHADGPERIAGEWWRRDAEMRAVRDYWRIEDEAGRRFWLFRAGDGVEAPCVRGVAARIGLANPGAQDTGIGSIWTTLQGSRGGAPAAAGEFGA